MNLKELLKKVMKANELNEELEIGEKTNLVITNRYSSPVRIYNTKDIKKIKDKYIEEISNQIINNELERIERYTYKITNTEYEIVLEF